FGAGGMDLPQLVLAISRNGAGAGIGNYNIVTIGGVGGGNAALILDDGVNGLFRALAVDNLVLPALLPLGDVVSGSYGLPGYAHPAPFDRFDPITAPDLLALTGPLPSDTLVGSAAVPEPASIVMMSLGLVSVGGVQMGRRLRRRRAESK